MPPRRVLRDRRSAIDPSIWLHGDDFLMGPQHSLPPRPLKSRKYPEKEITSESSR